MRGFYTYFYPNPEEKGNEGFKVFLDFTPYLILDKQPQCGGLFSSFFAVANLQLKERNSPRCKQMKLSEGEEWCSGRKKTRKPPLLTQHSGDGCGKGTDSHRDRFSGKNTPLFLAPDQRRAIQERGRCGHGSDRGSPRSAGRGAPSCGSRWRGGRPEAAGAALPVPAAPRGTWNRAARSGPARLASLGPVPKAAGKGGRSQPPRPLRCPPGAEGLQLGAARPRRPRTRVLGAAAAPCRPRR